MGKHRKPSGRHRALQTRPINPRPTSGRRIAFIALVASALILYPATVGDEQGSILKEVVVPFFQGEASASEEVNPDNPDPDPITDVEVPNPGSD